MCVSAPLANGLARLTALFVIVVRDVESGILTGLLVANCLHAAGHDLNGEVDQMRKVRIKPDKAIFVELRTAGRPLQLDTLIQRGAAVLEHLPEDRLLALLLAQHTAGGDLADTGGRQIDLVLEKILKFM
jgi:hypothetical protein